MRTLTFIQMKAFELDPNPLGNGGLITSEEKGFLFASVSKVMFFLFRFSVWPLVFYIVSQK